MKTINYTMTADYRSNWNAIDAIREIVQNCLDNRQNASTYVLKDDGTVSIETTDFILPLSTLALGESEKPDGAIGGFGEGLKLALMILEREGCNIKVTTGDKILNPSFEMSDTVERETFCINIIEDQEYFDGLRFEFNINPDYIEELKAKVNVFSNDILPLPNRDSVDIVEHMPGVVMVNGLYVCEELKFRYGYNFAPGKLELGCDRQIASTFGMAWETSKVWADRVNESNADEVLNMISEGCLDVADIQYHIPEQKAVLIADAFTRRFGHVKIKQVGSSLGYGMAVNNSLYNTMKKSGRIEVTNPFEESGTPYSKIKELMAKEKKHMRSRAYKALEALLEDAKNWK
jgi:hypothetical protein